MNASAYYDQGETDKQQFDRQTFQKPFYAALYVRVLAAIAVAVTLGHFWPAIAVDVKPFGAASSS